MGEHGYWRVRSLAYTDGNLPRLLEWLGLPGDLVFILLGALPILLAVALGYLSLWASPPTGRRDARPCQAPVRAAMLSGCDPLDRNGSENRVSCCPYAGKLTNAPLRVLLRIQPTYPSGEGR
jgi:hypothetical protein